jgi:hypothetical protein
MPEYKDGPDEPPKDYELMARDGIATPSQARRMLGELAYHLLEEGFLARGHLILRSLEILTGEPRPDPPPRFASSRVMLRDCSSAMNSSAFCAASTPRFCSRASTALAS